MGRGHGIAFVCLFVCLLPQNLRLKLIYYVPVIRLQFLANHKAWYMAFDEVIQSTLFNWNPVNQNFRK